MYGSSQRTRKKRMTPTTQPCECGAVLLAPAIRHGEQVIVIHLHKAAVLYRDGQLFLRGRCLQCSRWKTVLFPPLDKIAEQVI